MTTRNTFNNGGLFTQVKTGAGYEGGKSKLFFCASVVATMVLAVGAAVYFL